MNKSGWILLAASAMAFGQNSQPAQTGKPVVSTEMVQHSQSGPVHNAHNH